MIKVNKNADYLSFLDREDEGITQEPHLTFKHIRWSTNNMTKLQLGDRNDARNKNIFCSQIKFKPKLPLFSSHNTYFIFHLRLFTNTQSRWKNTFNGSANTRQTHFSLNFKNRWSRWIWRHNCWKVVICVKNGLKIIFTQYLLNVFHFLYNKFWKKNND